MHPTTVSILAPHRAGDQAALAMALARLALAVAARQHATQNHAHQTHKEVA